VPWRPKGPIVVPVTTPTFRPSLYVYDRVRFDAPFFHQFVTADDVTVTTDVPAGAEGRIIAIEGGGPAAPDADALVNVDDGPVWVPARLLSRIGH
jgi:hypothetical protein